MRAGWIVAFVVGSCAVAHAQPIPASNAETDKLDAELREQQAKRDFTAQEKTIKKLIEAHRKLSGEDGIYVWRQEQALISLYAQTNDQAKAVELADKMLAQAERVHGKDSREVYDVIGYKIAAFQIARAFDADLEALFQRVLAISRKLNGDKSQMYAFDLQRYANHLETRGEVQAALRVQEQAYRIEKAIGTDTSSRAMQIGLLYMQVDMTKAKQYFDEFLAGQKKNSIDTQMNMTWWVSERYRYANRVDLSQPLEKQALDMARKELARIEKDKGKDAAELTSPLFTLGNMLMQIGDYAAAEPIILRSIALAEKLKSPVVPYGSLAVLRRKQGKPKEALAMFEKAQATIPGGTGLYSMMGDIYRELGDYKKAEKLYLDAQADLDKQFGKNAILVLRLNLGLYAVYVSANKLDKAEKVLADHLERAEKELSFVLATGTETDHLAYFTREAYLLDTAIGFHAKVAPKRAAAARIAMTTVLRRKGRILDAAAASLGKLRARLPDEDKKLLAELELARAKLAKVAVQGSAVNPNFAKEVAELEEQVSRLEVTLARKNAELKLALSPVKLADVQKRIPKTAKLVEIVNYQPGDPTAKYEANPKKAPRRYIAYVLGSTGDPVLVDLGEAQPIDDAVVKLRAALSDPDNDTAIDQAKSVYKLAFARIAKALGATKQVLIAPDGALNVVPFAALHDGKQFLVESLTFTYLTSGRDLLRQTARVKPKQSSAVIFADPAFDAKPTAQAGAAQRRSRSMGNLTWPRLPGTAAEADALEKTLPKPIVYRGDKATETTLKGLAAPPILHLATHGFFLADEDASVENPLLRSGLVFAGANGLSSNNDDGVVTALEAAGLDLRGTQLVVMSACETGVGKLTNGEGVYGLRRALVIAGAESLVMSMWQVDDAATKDLMAGYYKKLQGGLGRSEALRAIQRELHAKPKYAHPYFWASFIASGDATPIAK